MQLVVFLHEELKQPFSQTENEIVSLHTQGNFFFTQGWVREG